MASGMLVIVVLLLMLFALIPFVWWLLCLIQAVKVPDSQWAAADQNKIVYVLLMVLLGLIGTIIYVIVARPALRRVGALA